MTWQQRHKDGLCTNCARKLKDYLWRCNPCELAQRKRNRKYTNSKPWKKGKSGRPPRVKA